MSDSLQYQQCRQLKDEGEQLRKAQRFSEAAELFKKAFELCHDSYAASKYIHCLCRTGDEAARVAAKFARQAEQQFSDDQYIKKEWAWALYYGYLKDAEGDEIEEAENIDDQAPEQIAPSADLTTKVKAGRTIFRLTTDLFARKQAAFAICKEAKLLKKWDLVLEFAQQLDPQMLSLEQKELNGRRLLSDYQRWAFAITRALLELERYDECITHAREASEKFPQESFHFQRWEALAKIRMGQVEDGLKQLEYLNMRFPKQWYIQSDIANAHVRLGQDEDALLWFSRAAMMPGDPHGRILILKSMCEVLQRLANWQAVYEHLRLIWIIELELGSKRYAERTEQHLHEFQRLHADQLRIVSEDGIPTLSSALKPCRVTWQKTIKSAQPTQRGRISFLDEEKRFGFVTNDEGRFHFKFNTFRGKPELNMWVEFETEDSFDQKRGKASKIAVNVRPAKGPEAKA
ncbi:MAG TPA: hypothetical protein VFA09_02070 [Ktedonobacteraceae bacterium]|nr:hypothetical protein [Ktedonobacteraceae bacterium]